MTVAAETRCLWHVRPSAEAEATLLLLPHSGAAAQNFAGWREAFGPEVELIAAQYPGRASRASEPLPMSVREAADEIAAAVAPLGNRPLHIFGHSLGAFVGFELAWRLTESRRAPASLIVSGAPPLHLERPEQPSPRTMSDAEMWREIERYGADLASLMRYPDLAARFLGVCRADMAMATEYRFGPEARRLSVPMLAMGGREDPIVPATVLPRWAELTTGPCECQNLPGGHFYFEDELDAAVALIARHLDRLGG